MGVAELKADLERAVMEVDRGKLILLSTILDRLAELEARVRDLETRQSPERYLDHPGEI